MNLKKLVRRVLMALLALNVFGCAAALEERVIFPLPPDTPRLEWIGTFNSEGDFRGGMSKFLVGEGGGGTGFASVMGLTGLSDGRLLVCDIAAQRLKTLDLEQKKIGMFTDYRFRSLVSVDSDQQGQVYVSDSADKKVLVFSAEGALLRTIGDAEVFLRPSFLSVNDDLARLYVSDPEANNIKVFSLVGELLFTIGQRGVEPGEFHVPQGLAFDADGQLFVADSLNARIQVLSADGEPLRQFGSRGAFNHQMEAPKALAFDSEGNLYLTDSRKPSFRIFDPQSGALLLSVGAGANSDHKLGFKLPTGIYVDRQDRVYIGDLLNARVTVWQYLSASYLQGLKPQ